MGELEHGEELESGRRRRRKERRVTGELTLSFPCRDALLAHLPPEWSGAGERHGVDGPGERLCVGEPERLSLDDWWKPEEKLRELCMGGGGGCLDSFFRMLRRRLHRNEQQNRHGICVGLDLEKKKKKQKFTEPQHC